MPEYQSKQGQKSTRCDISKLNTAKLDTAKPYVAEPFCNVF